MKNAKKVIIGIVLAVLAIAIGLVVFYFVHYYGYKGYQSHITSYEVEEGTPFKAASDSSKDVEGFTLVSESDVLKLYINETTTEVAVYDKRTGVTTYSVPQDVDEDPLVNSANISTVKSQIILYYLDAKNNPVTEGYSSYKYGVEKNQFNLESIKDGVRVNYQLGNFESATGIVPLSLTEARFDELCGQMDEKSAKEMKSRYEHDGGNYVLRSTGPVVVRKIKVALESIGYTEADRQADVAATGVEGATSVNFNVSVDFRLDNDSIVVNVPTSKMTEAGGAKIYKVELLNYFAAAGKDEEGYMVVPNGAGSIINFNNGKTNTEDYRQQIYGQDVMSAAVLTQFENTENAMLPVMGMVKKDSAVFEIVEDGDALATLNATIAGKITSYNTCYTSFIVRNYELVEMSGGSMTVVQPDLFDANLQVRYAFPEKNAEGTFTYVDLAKYYRDYLIARGELTDTMVSKEGDIPLYLDVIGGVKETSLFLGIQRLSVMAMTTFNQAGQIVDDLASKDVPNIRMNFQGWFNGGYYHDTADMVVLENKLGSKGDFEKLSDKLESNGGKLYADVAFQDVTSISKRYFYSTESSRYYGSGFVAIQGVVDPTSLRSTAGLGYQEVRYYLLSPKFQDRYVNGFTSKIDSYDVTGISLRDLANELQADYKRTEVISRQEALQITKDSLKAIDATGKNVMENSANAYGWAVADDIINVPMDDNDFFVVDDYIPFYQMVLHGYVDYASEPINLAKDYDLNEITLDCIETGSYPHFTVTYKDSSEMKYTGLNSKYATTYEKWADDIAATYKTLNDTIGKVKGETVVAHEEISNNVYKIVYSNGVTFVVNKNDYPAEAEGITLDAESYYVKGVE